MALDGFVTIEKLVKTGRGNSVWWMVFAAPDVTGFTLKEASMRGLMAAGFGVNLNDRVQSNLQIEVLPEKKGRYLEIARIRTPEGVIQPFKPVFTESTIPAPDQYILITGLMLQWSKNIAGLKIWYAQTNPGIKLSLFAADVWGLQQMGYELDEAAESQTCAIKARVRQTQKGYFEIVSVQAVDGTDEISFAGVGSRYQAAERAADKAIAGREVWMK